MSLWTMLRCDFFKDGRVCPKMFRTQLDWKAALQEAKTYGWSQRKDGAIRCSEHRDMDDVRPIKEDQE